MSTIQVIPGESLRLSPMTYGHIDEVVRIHLSSFPRFFLSALGSRFLVVLYQEVLRDTSGIGLVCLKNNVVCGFVAGTDAPAGFYRRLLYRRWWRFALAAAKPVLFNPALVPRLLNAFRRPQQAASSREACELMSIAVAPGVQGTGVGRRLVRGFAREASARGRRYIVLTTDQADNEQTNLFYVAQGFQIARTIRTAQGRMLNEYKINVDNLSIDSDS